jgi:acetylornithine deacetylase/succinyl-diaminopimelate desuccinylase-like protein
VTPVELLQQLIRFDTTNPPGNEGPCIEFLRGLIEDAGVATEVYAKEPGRPNLVARLRGGDSGPLLLQGHVDVVTTSGQAWTHPPFAGELVDGYVWGRGALDMKGGVAMLVSAFLRAARERTPLRRDVILCLLADEEGGGDFGAKFMLEEHAHLFEGVRYALSEFGGFSQEMGGRRFYPIQVAEKQICWLKATVRGAGGHGALMQPRGGTMAKLGKLLVDLDRKRLPVHVTPAARAMFERLADGLPRVRRAAVRALLNPKLTDRVLPLLGERGRGFEPLLRNTVSATIVHAGEKINVVPAEVEIELDARALPGFTPAAVIAEVQAIAGKDVELDLVRHDPGPPDPDLALFDTLAGVLREIDPDAVPIPLLQAGVTDARFFARLGIQTYGFLPMRLPADFPFLRFVHAADERIPADAVEFGADALFRALQRL